jgi:predicted nucleotidyltransferase
MNNRKKELQHWAEKATEILNKDYRVKRVFLIGSLIKGYVHERSDIDLVVEGLAPELYFKALTQIYDILPSGIELNLIPFEDAFETLKEKTLREGMMIYS